MTRGRRIEFALFVTLTLAPAAFASDDDKVKEDNRPSEKLPGVRARVFDIKHRSPDDLLRVLKPLASGIKGTSIAESSEFKTITVRDFPENLSAIEEALKRLDLPVPPRPDVELKLRVLIAASNGPGQVPLELAPVVKQLQATLNYKGYYQIAAITQRVQAGRGSSGKGMAQLGPPITNEPATAPYSYAFETVTLGPAAAGGSRIVQVRNLKFSTGSKQLGDADIVTGLTLREGEKVVVGTASLKERALIVVLSVRILR